MSLTYGVFTAVDGVSLEVPPGTILSLLGPSGCGKTSLLKAIAGLIAPSAGRVYFDDRDVTESLPHRRNVGFLFQSYALFPHLSVEQNIAFGLKMRAVDRSRWHAPLGRMLEVFDIAQLRYARPHQLSGGQQQRVALARTLVVEPAILLLDEPLSALDRQLRESARIEIKRIVREIGITTVVVTHDQEEALGMSDRIAVMDHGVLHQVATPEELYRRPATPFVGSFVGGANFIDAVVDRIGPDGARLHTRTGGAQVAADPVPGLVLGAPVVLMLRPEDLRLEPPFDTPAVDGANALPASFVSATFLGDHHLVEVKLGDQQICLIKEFDRARGAELLRLRRGDAVRVAWAPSAGILFPAADAASVSAINQRAPA